MVDVEVETVDQLVVVSLSRFLHLRVQGHVRHADGVERRIIELVVDKKTSWFGEDVAMSEYIMGITLDEVMYLSSPGPLTWVEHATPDSDP